MTILLIDHQLDAPSILWEEGSLELSSVARQRYNYAVATNIVVPGGMVVALLPTAVTVQGSAIAKYSY
jgi:hypothetical protein